MSNYYTYLKTLLLILCPFYASAEEMKSLVVENLSDIVVFSLSENPIVKRSGGTLVVSTVRSSSEFEFSSVRRFFYGDNDVTENPDVLTEEDFFFYPNPCSDYLFVKRRNEDDGVAVRDVHGRLIPLQHSSEGDHFRLDLMELPQGTYLLQIGNETVKFVKR
jgi:hypothetical protein